MSNYCDYLFTYLLVCHLNIKHDIIMWNISATEYLITVLKFYAFVVPCGSKFDKK